jgi:hypothetical protein
MDVTSLVPAFKLHARVTHSEEDAAIVLMLAAAAGDIAHAANYTLPDDVMDLPRDVEFAIIDHATKLFDARGADEGLAGLSLAASRIVARYRGVSLGALPVEPEAAPDE